MFTNTCIVHLFRFIANDTFKLGGERVEKGFTVQCMNHVLVLAGFSNYLYHNSKQNLYIDISDATYELPIGCLSVYQVFSQDYISKCFILMKDNAVPLQSTFDISNSDKSNSAKLEASISIKNTF